MTNTKTEMVDDSRGYAIRNIRRVLRGLFNDQWVETLPKEAVDQLFDHKLVKRVNERANELLTNDQWETVRNFSMSALHFLQAIGGTDPYTKMEMMNLFAKVALVWDQFPVREWIEFRVMFFDLVLADRQ